MSVEILSTAAQLYEKSHFRKASSRWMTLKVTQGHRNNLCWISHKSLSINGIINSDFILQCFWDITTFRLTIQCTWLALTSRSPSFSKTKLKLQAARALPFMCKHIENNTRCISRGMGIRKVSNSKSDLPGHSRSPVTVPFDRPSTNTIS